METKMAASQENWIKHRAYELWEQEGYPSGKDAEHWERAKLEYATLKPTASKPTTTSKAAKPAAPKTAAKAVAKPAAKKAEKTADKSEAKPVKVPAAAAAVEPEQTKKQPKKLAAE
jgi:hypothetical protein